MWQRFTERSRRVVFFAQEEAGRLGESAVSAEHLLLGLLREPDTVAARVLHRLDISLERLRNEVEQRQGRGEGRLGQDMQLTPDAKRVIDLAYDEARKLDNNYIGTEHLLLGIVRDTQSAASQLLQNAGADYDATFSVVQRMQQEKHSEKQEQEQLEGKKRPQVGDLGVAQSPEERDYIEVAHDVAAYIELVHVFQARDAHGYRALLQGDQTMFILPGGTPIKLLATPANGVAARDLGGSFIRVLAGDFEGYAGWICSDCFARTGPDESPFPPPIGD